VKISAGCANNNKHKSLDLGLTNQTDIYTFSFESRNESSFRKVVFLTRIWASPVTITLLQEHYTIYLFSKPTITGTP
jgi:hypothetical protein